jgi:hypothetical protein
MNEGGSNCPFKEYPGEKEELPEEILIKVNNIEKLMGSYCKKIEESSSLMIMYKETTDTSKMLGYFDRIREINPKAYNESLLMRRICKEIESILK